MISSQYGTEFTETQYEKIRKVYSIWICPNPPKKRENTITRYCVQEENLVGQVLEQKENYDLLTVVMICWVMYNVPYKVDTARERDCLKC